MGVALKKKYQIVYADPPWSYDFGKSSSRYIESQYSTMTIKELCDLSVKNIADDDSLLLIWVTFPKLESVFEVIESWGFSYRTVLFNWVKTYSNSGKLFMGCGYYTRSNSEICLLAKRGKGLKAQVHNINSAILSPYTGHSEKPAIIRKKIVELFGDVSRIELFARKEKGSLFEDESFEGWDVWGNEVESDIELKGIRC